MSTENVLGLSTVSNRNQTTLPRRVRKELDLKPGDRVLWVLEASGKVYVRKT